jgi:hypothetical protein
MEISLTMMVKPAGGRGLSIPCPEGVVHEYTNISDAQQQFVWLEKASRTTTVGLAV